MEVVMLFDRKIEPCCEYCVHSTPLGYNEIVCGKRGVMESSGSCGAFRYEPTKREPVFALSLATDDLTEDDFAL